ncbi:hypothetical protein AR457_01360 [Streptomyces agglomeratus]|nr:hypothetical protein AR457_01360 [Streptomyces agglomeratus]
MVPSCESSVPVLESSVVSFAVSSEPSVSVSGGRIGFRSASKGMCQTFSASAMWSGSWLTSPLWVSTHTTVPLWFTALNAWPPLPSAQSTCTMAAAP